jgi:hypothetical protein
VSNPPNFCSRGSREFVDSVAEAAFARRESGTGVYLLKFNNKKIKIIN